MSQVPNWVNDFVGLPFKVLGRDRDGVDCWGLLRLVYLERYGVELPNYNGYTGTGRKDIQGLSNLIRGNLYDWSQVPNLEAREGDAVLLRIIGQPAHCGVLVLPRVRRNRQEGFILHVEEGINSCYEDLSRPRWQNRVLAFYRHRELLDAR